LGIETDEMAAAMLAMVPKIHTAIDNISDILLLLVLILSSLTD
jgi:hypothetical protein